jgi:hypothetical protein
MSPQISRYPNLLMLDYRRVLAQSGAELVCPPLPIRYGEFLGLLGARPARPDYLA